MPYSGDFGTEELQVCSNWVKNISYVTSGIHVANICTLYSVNSEPKFNNQVGDINIDIQTRLQTNNPPMTVIYKGEEGTCDSIKNVKPTATVVHETWTNNDWARVSS